jgi:streptomycin 6-kinase
VSTDETTTGAVPPVVRNKALAAGAGRWLRDLPGLITELERDWSVTVGRSYEDPTEAFVAEATRDDGTPAVLKVHIDRPGAHAVNEITVLRLADGAGCARLLVADAARGALLLERLGPSLSQLALAMPERHEILCAAAERVRRPAPDCDHLPTGADKGRQLADFIPATWERLGRPCTERAIADALACLARRIAAHDEERAVLAHGDVHQWNALQAAGGVFKLVDPDGLIAEAEYDMGILMREDPVELLHGDPHDRARWLAARCGLDATAIWEWGVAERVATGLSATEIELQPFGSQMLATADQVASK